MHASPAFRRKSRNAKRQRHRAARERRLFLEPLEIRTMLAALPPDGLVSWWRAEGDVQDFAGPNDLGSLQNGASFATGIVGQAFRFDGTNDYVDLGSSATLDVADFTIEAWVGIDPATNQGERRVFSRDDVRTPGADGRETYNLKSSFSGADGRPAFGLLKDGAVSFVASPKPLSEGFHHLAGVRAGNELRLYVDGELVGKTTTTIAGVVSPESPLVLGQVSPDFGGEFFAGLIDEPGVYNRALSAGEVRSIFDAGSEGKATMV